jgi:hypothetical protein
MRDKPAQPTLDETIQHSAVMSRGRQPTGSAPRPIPPHLH